MSNRAYIEERLQSKDLKKEEREALQRALDACAPVYLGFQVGERVRWAGNLTDGTVITVEERGRNSIGNMTDTDRYVPVRFDDGYTSGIEGKGLRKI